MKIKLYNGLNIITIYLIIIKILDRGLLTPFPFGVAGSSLDVAEIFKEFYSLLLISTYHCSIILASKNNSKSVGYLGVMKKYFWIFLSCTIKFNMKFYNVTIEYALTSEAGTKAGKRPTSRGKESSFSFFFIGKKNFPNFLLKNNYQSSLDL